MPVVSGFETEPPDYKTGPGQPEYATLAALTEALRRVRFRSAGKSTYRQATDLPTDCLISSFPDLKISIEPNLCGERTGARTEDPGD